MNALRGILHHQIKTSDTLNRKSYWLYHIFVLYLQLKNKMTWNELRKIILKKGWVLYKHGSRHDLYQKAGRTDLLLLERHWTEEIKPNLHKRLLKQIEEFNEENSGNH